MKQLPNDVVVGGAYYFAGVQVIVTAVKPKGRGWYVEYWSPPDGPTVRAGMEPFRRMANVNQREVA